MTPTTWKIFSLVVIGLLFWIGLMLNDIRKKK